MWKMKSYFDFGYLPLDSQSYVSRNIVMTNQPFSIYHFLELLQQIFFPIDVIACLYTVKPLSIIPVCVVCPQLSFISSGPENCVYEQHVIILEALFIRVSFSYVICSKFPLLTHSMPKNDHFRFKK
jgi:hypothetical protein